MHEDRVTPWRAVWWDDTRLAAVRIWDRLTPFGMFQRHEWRYHDGREWAEEWIPTARKRWAHNAEPVAQPAMTNDVIAALQSIASGHNDPRSLALDTLAKINPA